jgi:hypothetical protein
MWKRPFEGGQARYLIVPEPEKFSATEGGKMS